MKHANPKNGAPQQTTMVNAALYQARNFAELDHHQLDHLTAMLATTHNDADIALAAYRLISTAEYLLNGMACHRDDEHGMESRIIHTTMHATKTPQLAISAYTMLAQPEGVPDGDTGPGVPPTTTIIQRIRRGLTNLDAELQNLEHGMTDA